MFRKIIILACVYLAGVASMQLLGDLRQYLRVRALSPQEAACQELEAMYLAGLTREVADISNRYRLDPTYQAMQPRLLYLEWLSQLKMAHLEEGEKLEALMLESFPTNELAAEMRFAKAVRFRRAGDYVGAERELDQIDRWNPSSPAQATAARLRASGAVEEISLSELKRVGP